MYYVLLSMRTNEHETYCRNLVESGKGFEDIEEAKKVKIKKERLDKIERTSDIEKEKAIAIAEDREPKKDDGWYHLYTIVELIEHK